MKFKTKLGKEFEAIKYTGENTLEIITDHDAHKCVKTDQFGETYETMVLALPDGQTMLIGDWISSEGDVYKDDMIRIYCDEV